VGAFIAKHLVFEKDATSTTGEVRAKYVAFCEENGDLPVGAKRLWPRVRIAAKASGVDLTETSVRKQLPFSQQVSVVNGYKGVRVVGNLLTEIDALLAKIGDDALARKVHDYLELHPQSTGVAYSRLLEIIRERKSGVGGSTPWGAN